jgi:4-hydroxymandelate oxidase
LLDPATLGYFAGGAADEISMRDNVRAWRRLAIRPRVLVGVGEIDRSVTVLGRPRPNPLIVAPMAYQGLAHPDAEIGTAKAAAATGATVCIPTFATTDPVAVAAAAPDASRWFQVYVFPDRGISHELISRALDSGYEALVVTADLPVGGFRERELRAEATVVASAATHVTDDDGTPLSPADLAGNVDPDLTWADIERLAAEYPVPILVKGILTPEDALLAAEHGAQGVVVSNHGGRQLDTVLSGADALPAVLEAVGDRLDVLVDGGVRRGTDVLKALALGARAVLVGRPVLWGLTVDGAAGAQRVLEILLDEFDRALALTGTPRVGDLDPSFLTPAPWLAERR